MNGILSPLNINFIIDDKKCRSVSLRPQFTLNRQRLKSDLIRREQLITLQLNKNTTFSYREYVCGGSVGAILYHLSIHCTQIILDPIAPVHSLSLVQNESAERHQVVSSRIPDIIASLYSAFSNDSSPTVRVGNMWLPKQKEKHINTNACSHSTQYNHRRAFPISYAY